MAPPRQTTRRAATTAPVMLATQGARRAAQRRRQRQGGERAQCRLAVQRCRASPGASRTQQLLRPRPRPAIATPAPPRAPAPAAPMPTPTLIAEIQPREAAASPSCRAADDVRLWAPRRRLPTTASRPCRLRARRAAALPGWRRGRQPHDRRPRRLAGGTLLAVALPPADRLVFTITQVEGKAARGAQRDRGDARRWAAADFGEWCRRQARWF